jgi:GNAT superfamily N-acetyltransferase
VLERSRGLSPAALTAIAELERRVVRADGGRLKLEWGNLRARPSDQVNDFLWWADDIDHQLLGFCGIYRFGGSDPEIAGMVDPEHRRRGIASSLFDAVAANLRDRSIGRDRGAGARAAARRSARSFRACDGPRRRPDRRTDGSGPLAADGNRR